MLNGKSTKDAVTIVDVEEKDIEHISLQNNLQALTEIVNKLNTDNDHEFIEDFQSGLNEEALKIKNCLNNNVPNYIYANVVIQSQFTIQKYLAKKLISKLDGDVKDTATLLFDNIFESGNNLVELINNLYPKIEDKTETLRNQLEDAWKAADEITDFEEKYKIANKEKELIANEKNIIQNKLEKLESENKIMTETLMKTAKDICSITMGNQQKPTNNLTTTSGVCYNNQINTTSNAHNINNMHSRQQQNTNQFNNNPISITTQNYISGTNAKVLTIKMTKDIMNEIYNSKALFDKRCYENKQARETMEQHMYTYLNQKYGLKNLIIEWASSIINAIKLYSSEDSDINLFGKILRNEQEEDSRLILLKLRSTISELLEYYLKSKNPLKSAKDIKKMLESKKEGLLTEEEWQGIIYYIYNEEDAQNIDNRINNFIQKQNTKNNQGSNENIGMHQNPSNLNNSVIPFMNTGAQKKLTREEIFNLNKVKEEMSISYKDFIKLVSDHQIRSREKYLKNFVKLFRKFDSDSDGILDEKEFINLLKDIPSCKENVETIAFKFLSVIDPFNNQKVTFSECVSIFSMEFIKGEEGKPPVSLLDKICLEDSNL